MSQRFEFAFVPRYERAARMFGITPERAWVEVGDGRLDARYGRWQLVTPLSNVRGLEITGPYRFFKTAGPPRLGVTDLGITFASNGKRGLLILFHQRVRAIEPAGVLRHGELTVTVTDVEGLAAAIAAGAGLPSDSYGRASG